MKTGKYYKGLLLLSALFVIAPLVIWKAALEGTYRTMSETVKLKKVVAANESLAGSTPRLIIATEGEDLITDGLILDKVKECAETNRLKIIEYQPYSNESNGGLTLLSAEITVTGSFVSIVKVIDELESRVPECRVKSIEFNKTQQRGDRTDVLKAVIVVQQLIST